MYIVVEIDKTSLYDGTFSSYLPYVYHSTVSSPTVASWWTDWGGSDDFPDAEKNISGIVLDSIFDVQQVNTLANCITQENSFYFDYDNQLLYLHTPHTKTPYGSSVLSGIAFGFTDDQVRYFRNQLYRPLVQQIPSLSDSCDPLQYGIIAFGGGNVVITNDVVENVGMFDTDERLYGNIMRIKCGDEGDTYDDLRLISSNYIRDYILTTSDITFDIADKRERLQTLYPTATMDILESYSDGAWQIAQRIMPDGYGLVMQAPAYPIADLSGTVRFRWGNGVTSITQVYAFHDDVLSPIAHTAFSTDGTFEIADALCAIDGANPTKGLKKIYVTGVMRDITNPADIIADLNDRIMGIAFTASNYDVSEWTAEKASLADISLYMDESKKIYEWIEILQNGANWGFRYEDVDKITIRRDDPSRESVVSIPAIAIRNSDIPIRRNAELYASSCIVRYAKNHRTNAYMQTENADYESAVINEHRVKKQQIYETLITSETIAQEKALRVMQDISVVRPIITLEVDISLFNQTALKRPRIYDMVDAVVSLVTQAKRIPALWTFVLGDIECVIGDDDCALGERHDVTHTQAYGFSESKRAYYGNLHGQIIGIQWNVDRNTVSLNIRQRDA